MKNTLFSIMLQRRSGRQRNLRDRNSSSKRMLDFGAENGSKLVPFGGHFWDPKLIKFRCQKRCPKKTPPTRFDTQPSPYYWGTTGVLVGYEGSTGDQE